MLKILYRLGWCLALGLLGLGLWAFWLEPDSLRVNHYDLPLHTAGAPIDGLTIAALSDLHAGAPFIDTAKLRRVVALTNAAHPDLILIAGDIFAQAVIGGHRIDPTVVADALSGMHAPLGVFAVLGNHDVGGNVGRFRAELQRVGITPIDNDVRRIDRGDAHFWLAGFADLQTGGPKVDATLARIDDDAPVIALTHDPELLPQLPARVNLLIAGHTHGGQVRLPLFSRVILRETRDSPLHWLRGHYLVQTDLFVTTGIGTSNLPVRFRVPPEIALLHLRQDSTP